MCLEKVYVADALSRIQSTSHENKLLTLEHKRSRCFASIGYQINNNRVQGGSRSVMQEDKRCLH